MAIEFYKDKSGFIVDSRDIDWFKHVVENGEGY